MRRSLPRWPECRIFVTVKKTFAIFFCFLYFVSVSGIALNLHYCGGKIKSISFTHTDESGCCKGKMKKAGCCKETTAYAKVEDSQASASHLQVPQGQCLQLLATLPATAVYLEKALTATFHAQAVHPPGYTREPCYLRKRVLLI